MLTTIDADHTVGVFVFSLTGAVGHVTRCVIALAYRARNEHGPRYVDAHGTVKGQGRLPRSLLPVVEVLALLEATPERIGGMTAGVAPEQLRSAPVHDAWSATDVLAHLRSCADVWGDCIRAMLAEDHPTLRAIDPRTWIMQTNYSELEFAPSFRAFVEQRSELLAVLWGLTPEDWQRSATVRGAGKPLVRTVLGYANRLAIHERSHMRQMDRIVRAVHSA